MKRLLNKISELPTEVKVEITRTAATLALSYIGRKTLIKKGMVKSFWYGLPHKPGTFR